MHRKVLYGCSPRAFKDKGGGEVLLLKTSQYIEGLGFKAEVFNQSQKLSGFDLFHNFNIHRDCFAQVENAKKAGLRVVVSPVYWPSLRYALLWHGPIAKKAKHLAFELLNKADLLGLTAAKKMLGMADVITPSSVAEAAILESTFNAKPEKIRVVHNGVEKRFENARPNEFEKRYGIRDFVLYAGRIEERKNVLSLVRALNGTGKQLVVIGNAKSGSEAYYARCKKEAGSNALFIPGLNHESSLLASAYAACKVFALPSWYETPGLAALEAGLAGANIVVTKEGPTKEYFAGFASYVRPGSVPDIREKLLLELQGPKSKGLSRHIKGNFLWQNTARQTAQAYEKALEGRP